MRQQMQGLPRSPVRLARKFKQAAREKRSMPELLKIADRLATAVLADAGGLVAEDDGAASAEEGVR